MIEQAVQDARTDHAIDVERLQQENERLRAEVARWKACARGAVAADAAAQRELIDRFGGEEDEDHEDHEDGEDGEDEDGEDEDEDDGDDEE